MRVLSCVGARPQFIKAAVVSSELKRRGVEEFLVHTGQHYDPAMSAVFFRDLPLPAPSHELGVGSGTHGAQTGAMMERLDPIVRDVAPDFVLVYGDTNSTLAAALVAAKLNVPVAHVEAGLRSFDRTMPEEVNRVVTDHVSSVLFAPNAQAARQLAYEGIAHGVFVVGDVMVDLARRVAATLPARPPILDRFGLEPQTYGVATVHRAANTDDRARFAAIVDGLRRVDMPIVFPAHPRTRSIAIAAGAGTQDNLILCEPLTYFETIALAARARMIFTDSGGLQKEAFVLRVPCVTLRDTTEWTETLDAGWNVLADANAENIVRAARRRLPAGQSTLPYPANASAAIVDVLSYESERSSRYVLAR